MGLRSLFHAIQRVRVPIGARRWVVAAALATPLGGCDDTADRGCFEDGCPRGQRCEEGLCVLPSGGGNGTPDLGEPLVDASPELVEEDVFGVPELAPPLDVGPPPNFPPTNACGGLVPLNWEGAPAHPGDVCGWGDGGFLVCNGPNALRCEMWLPPNDCGGFGTLPARVGEDCDCGGTWVCDGPTSVRCAGGAPVNACGGCQDLLRGPGLPCADGLIYCAGPDEVLCAPVGNACGGSRPLIARPGTDCSTDCGPGRWFCASDELVVCLAPTACNACGGTAPLAGEPGDPCGPWEDGAWQCLGIDAVACIGATTWNPCGGEEPLEAEPGEECAPNRVWMCKDDDLTCQPQLPDGVRNNCGGTRTLGATPGTPCGDCGAGVTVCASPDETRCRPPHRNPRSACGGCSAVQGLPGQPCGTCGDGTLACRDTQIVCQDATQRRNACDSCGTLPGVPGQRCEPCADWACEQGRAICTPYAPDACPAPALTCADLACDLVGRTCIPGSDIVDARCGSCLESHEAVGGDCLLRLVAVQNVQASDGTSAAHVVVNWEAVAGATGYHVFRDGLRVTTSPVSGLRFNDTGASPGGPPGVPPNLRATDTRTDGIHLTWDTAAPGVAGSPHSYQVQAVATGRAAPLSLADAGHRGPLPASRYLVSSDHVESETSSRSHTDRTIDAGAFRTITIRASTDREDGIYVNTTETPTIRPTTAVYRVRAINAGGTSGSSAPAMGQRLAGPIRLRWQSATSVDGPWTDLAGWTGEAHLDEDPTTSNGRFYRLQLSATGVSTWTTAPAFGRREGLVGPGH